MKKKKVAILLGLTLALGLTTGCSFLPGPGEEESTSNSQGEVLPNPIGLSITKKPDTLLYGQSIDINKEFKVSVKYDNNTSKEVPYDAKRSDGWYFRLIIDPDARSLTNFPSVFNKLGTYTYTLGYIKDNKSLIFDETNKAPQGEIIVKGGASSEIAPERLEINLTKDKYFIGETFQLETIDAVGYWPSFGGNDKIDNQDLTVTGVDFDITKPIQVQKRSAIEVSYRGITKQAEFNVLSLDNLEKSKVNYDYNDLNRDGFTLTDVMSTTGNPKALIVPIWFDDSHNYISNSNKPLVKDMIETAYLGTKQETGWHSVKTYYEEDSFHQLHIEGVVDDWYEYHQNSYNVSEEMTVELVKLVSNNYREKLRKANHLSDWLDFDRDKDGFLDAVILIYGAPSYPYFEDRHLPVNENLWAYCFWVQTLQANKLDPVPNVFFWASFDFMLTEQPKGSPIIVDAHTYIHEMGHILGLDDYYDYTAKTMPAGLYTMQDANVGGHDPFSRLAYGWLDPYVPTKSCTIKLKPFESSGETIVLCPNWDGSAFNEYIIMDYWTPDGLNKLDCTYEYGFHGPLGPNVSGLRVWHVDARLARITINGELTGEMVTRARPNEYVDLQCSNTTYLYGNKNADTNGYCADIDELRKFDLLALLNHSESNSRNTYKFNEIFSKEHLWQVGDTFTMNEFKNSFPNAGKLDSKLDLGFGFEVISKTPEEMVINVTKY